MSELTYSEEQYCFAVSNSEHLPKGDGLYLTTIKTDGEDKSPYLNGPVWGNLWTWTDATMRCGYADSGISAMKDYRKRVQEEKRRMSETKDWKKPDMVNHPPHYQSESGIEVIDIIDDFVADPASYYKGNIIKYILRYEKKGGSEDLKKARWYLNRLIACEGVKEQKQKVIRE